MTWRNRIVGHDNVPPDQLLANSRNFRIHPAAQQDALSAVIAEVGYVSPVLVRAGTDEVLDGHLRVRLALRDNEPTIPVTYVDVSDAEAALILATLDPLAAMAGTDAAQLAALLAEVRTDEAATQALLDDLAKDNGIEIEAGGLTDPDDVPEPPADPITKPGDLWRLGDHRLLCDDATAPPAVERLLRGERAAMAFTDPPYAIYGSSTGVGSETADDKMVRPFFRDVLLACQRHTEAFAHTYVCCDWRSWAAWWDMAKAARLQVKNCIVWDKGTPGQGSMYRPQHEFLLFLANSYQSTATASGNATGQRVVQGDGNVWTVPRAPSAEKLHNAQKPVALIERAITASSDAGDIVLDLFAGSGSTLVACVQTGRRCATMDVDPVWCDVTVRRWEALTGQTAEIVRPEETP